MKPEYENEVIQALQDKFLLNRDGSFLDAVEILSRQLAEEAAGDCLPDLLNNKKDSFLEELDNNSIPGRRLFCTGGSAAGLFPAVAASPAGH